MGSTYSRARAKKRRRRRWSRGQISVIGGSFSPGRDQIPEPSPAASALAELLGLVALPHPPIRLAEGDSLFQDQPVGLLGGPEPRIEPDALGMESHLGQDGGEDGEGLSREVDPPEERGLQKLQVPMVARGELGGDRQGLDETAL